MSATDSDNSIDWLASDDDESERESYSGGKSRESSPSSSPPPPPTTAPQSSPDESARRAKARDGSPPSCAVTWEPAAGLCKRQQGERTNPPHALKRPHGAAEEERGRDRPHPSGPPSEADRAFSRKCMELQCYIHPLSSILSGLRSGRYRERLSSFQESVAMDRIQRIMGVLRNPHMGGKYINIILKMEEMLKSWFPNVKLQDQPDVTQTEEAVPTKKLKPSPESTCPAASASDSPAAAAAVKALRVTDLTPPAAYSASNLKWLHTSPICSPTAENLLSPRNRDLTQDNSVSSSTDGGHAKTEPLARRPPQQQQQQQQQQQPQQQPRPPGKINAPCLERLLKATESIIGHKGAGGLMDSSWS